MSRRTNAPRRPSGAQRRAAEARRRRRNRVIAVLVGLAALAAVVAAVVAGTGGGGHETVAPTSTTETSAPSTTTTSAPPEDEGIQRFSGFSNRHLTTTITYPERPPVGGDHHAGVVRCGVYRQPVKDELAVHSIEHGAVWLTYNDDATDADIARLENFGRLPYMLISPYPTQTAPVIATAWGLQLRLHSASDPRLDRFVHNYREGSQTPEPGAAC